MIPGHRGSLHWQQRFCRCSGLLPLLLVLVLASTPARAERLAIGFEDLNFYPYGKPSAEKIYVGYLRALLDAFARDRGHELEFAVTPLKRLFQEFKGGDVDLFIPDNPTWSLQYKEGIDLYYSDTIAVALDGFAVLPGREKESVGGDILSIGAILGVTVKPLFSAAEKEQLKFDRASSFESIFRALFLERVDAAHCNLAAANRVLSDLGKEPAAVAWSTALPQHKSYFQISSTRPELIEELNRWLRAHEKTVTGLKEEYEILAGESMPWGGG